MLKTTDVLHCRDYHLDWFLRMNPMLTLSCRVSDADFPSTWSRARAVMMTSLCTSTRGETMGKLSSTPKREGAGRRRSDTPSPRPCRKWCRLRWRSLPSRTSSRSVFQLKVTLVVEILTKSNKFKVTVSGGSFWGGDSCPRLNKYEVGVSDNAHWSGDPRQIKQV